jgi:hypothetical protein
MAPPCRNCGGVVGACLAPDQPVLSGGENIIEFKGDGAGNTCLFVGAERVLGLAAGADEAWDPDVGLYGDPNLAELNAAGQLFVKRPCLENLTLTRTKVSNYNYPGILTISNQVTFNSVQNDSTRSTNPAISTALLNSKHLANIERTGIYTIETYLAMASVAEGTSPFVASFRSGPWLDSESGGSPVFGLPRGKFPEYGASFPNPLPMNVNEPPVATSSWTGLLQRGEILNGLGFEVSVTSAGGSIVKMVEAYASVTFLGPECA